MEFAVKKQLEHAATVRFDSELWQRVEQLAQTERRPVAHLILQPRRRRGGRCDWCSGAIRVSAGHQDYYV